MKGVAAGILTVMFTGLIGNALALWKNSAVVEHRVEIVEKKQEKQDEFEKAFDHGLALNADSSLR